MFVTAREGIQMMQNRRYAFHCDANTIYPLMGRFFTPSQICDFNVIRFRREKVQTIVTRKKSPFHDIFSVK